ncbi:hypothetical protein THAOC_29745, partial [Thalassiosira oceanica]
SWSAALREITEIQRPAPRARGSTHVTWAETEEGAGEGSRKGEGRGDRTEDSVEAPPAPGPVEEEGTGENPTARREGRCPLPGGVQALPGRRDGEDGEHDPAAAANDVVPTQPGATGGTTAEAPTSSPRARNSCVTDAASFGEDGRSLRRVPREDGEKGRRGGAVNDTPRLGSPGGWMVTWPPGIPSNALFIHSSDRSVSPVKSHPWLLQERIAPPPSPGSNQRVAPTKRGGNCSPGGGRRTASHPGRGRRPSPPRRSRARFPRRKSHKRPSFPALPPPSSAGSGATAGEDGGSTAWAAVGRRKGHWRGTERARRGGFLSTGLNLDRPEVRPSRALGYARDCAALPSAPVIQAQRRPWWLEGREQ